MKITSIELFHISIPGVSKLETFPALSEVKPDRGKVPRTDEGYVDIARPLSLQWPSKIYISKGENHHDGS